MKILVADDSGTDVADVLQRLGHEVIAVNSGIAAIDAFELHHPDLIMLDVVMNGMGGFECAEKIRAIETRGQDSKPEGVIKDWIPIIFLSDTVDDASITAGINAGGDDYLIKPFSEITLQAKIKAMQRISEMRNNLYNTTQELRVLSSTDTLTGAYNRFQFEKSLKEKLAEVDRHGLNLALLFIDLDHFKSINDTIGHHIGDLLLREVVKRIKTCIRYEDFLARIGGDEFVVILGFIDNPGNAADVAKTIIDILAPAFILDGHTVRISASIGIVCYPSPGIHGHTLVQNADIAMYHAKETGRNRYQFHSKELNDKYRQQISLEHDLKFALTQNELFLVYQPIYNLISKKIFSIESLLRWNHNEFGLISPKIFIPIAEETGLITQIGTWALRQACIQGAKWFQQGVKGMRVSVNLSLQQLLQDNFVQNVEQILNETGCPAAMLELELTETTIIAYTPHLKQTMISLHEMGINMGIDDFGTRHSSLTSLGNLPVSSLKIEKVFLHNVMSDRKNNIIVKSLIALGNNLNLNVIAEGVESEEQLQFLIVNGCQYGQGFHLSKPLPANELGKILDIAAILQNNEQHSK